MASFTTFHGRLAWATALLLAAACASEDPAAGPSSSPTSTDATGAGGSSSAATSSGAGAGTGTGTGTGGTPAPPDGSFPCRAEGDGTTTAVFINQCDGPLELRGSDIAEGTIEAGGFTCRDLGTDEEELSAKRYWGFIGDDPGAATHTLAEFTFNTDFQDFDWYNISHVDAHNLTMQIVPLDRDDCDVLTCADASLLDDCPDVGRREDGGGNLVSCQSPERDDPNSPVALHFESCDDGYAWSGDDQHGDDPSPVRACAAEDWAIVFCP